MNKYSVNQSDKDDSKKENMLGWRIAIGAVLIVPFFVKFYTWMVRLAFGREEYFDELANYILTSISEKGLGIVASLYRGDFMLTMFETSAVILIGICIAIGTSLLPYKKQYGVSLRALKLLISVAFFVSIFMICLSKSILENDIFKSKLAEDNKVYAIQLIEVNK